MLAVARYHAAGCDTSRPWFSDSPHEIYETFAAVVTRTALWKKPSVSHRNQSMASSGTGTTHAFLDQWVFGFFRENANRLENKRKLDFCDFSFVLLLRSLVCTQGQKTGKNKIK